MCQVDEFNFVCSRCLMGKLQDLNLTRDSMVGCNFWFNLDTRHFYVKHSKFSLSGITKFSKYAVLDAIMSNGRVSVPNREKECNIFLIFLLQKI